MKLEDVDGGGTRLYYDVDAQVGGKLAMLGSRLIDSTARSMATQFFDKFAKTVSSMKVEAAPDAEATPAKKAAKKPAKRAAKPARKAAKKKS